MQLLRDLFGYVAEAAEVLGIDLEFAQAILEVRERLAPMQIGKNGDLQEWLEDWPQKEDSHRHISHLYGLYPGHQISVRTTPDLAAGCRVVLEQRGLRGNGWSSAWKMACWARLHDPDMALANFDYYIRHYSYDNLFSICSRALQVDGTFGITAAVAELLLQSHEGELHLLPALPGAWETGEVKGLKARGGFELDMHWQRNRLSRATLRSRSAKTCRIRVPGDLSVFENGIEISVRRPEEGIVEFEAEAGSEYELRRP
jgi:alpha-L-fucosidase 2